MPLKTVDVITLNSWLKKGEAVLIDVREPGEHEAHRIPEAELMPLNQISKSNLPLQSGKKLVLHCKAGKRGETACQKLLAEDPSLELYNLAGGMDAWEKAGQKVTYTGKFFLPLDRQVQLTIGLGVLAGVILGYAIHPAFFLLSGFLGLG